MCVYDKTELLGVDEGNKTELRVFVLICESFKQQTTTKLRVEVTLIFGVERNTRNTKKSLCSKEWVGEFCRGGVEWVDGE